MRCFLYLVISVLLTGCVSIPAHTKLINTLHLSPSDMPAAECDSKKMLLASLDVAEPALQLDPQLISLLNWNIYKTQRENWSADFSSFALAQDIVLLQEAVSSPELIKLLEHQQPHWYMNAAFQLNNYTTGVLTGSNIRPVFNCGLRTTEPLIRVPKTILISLYPVAETEQRLLVVNLHGINFTLGMQAYTQQMRQMISVVQAHTGPLIVAGDFNTWSEQRLELIEEMNQQLSLQALSYKTSNRVRFFGHALDHVFYRGLEVIDEEVLPVSSSDHNPIKVKFRLVRQESESSDFLAQAEQQQ